MNKSKRKIMLKGPKIITESKENMSGHHLHYT